MSKVQEIVSLIEKAQEVKQTSTYKYRQFQDDYVVKKAQIKRKYSSDEAAEVSDYFGKVKARELLLSLRSQKREYTESLLQAKQLAERLIHAKVPKVDAEKQERFEKCLTELRTEILLANPKTAKDKLAAFIQSIDEPAFATRVRDIFTDLVTPILQAAGSDAGSYRQQLLGLFEGVKTSTLSEEAQEAIELLGVSEELLQTRTFNLAIETAIGQNFGPRISSFVNRPDEYFANNPDEDAPVIPEETGFIFEDPIARIPKASPQNSRPTMSMQSPRTIRQ
ncbi:hypothetical protein [Paenibacillus qinlingensis]|uniref:hypothetical protein n=1 Tax=Paenibacillus qinlingensis TaxID=1837343 RepID=UPI001565C17A|nr:hypothetical protein [Paenibacillus qinlingensis]NQX61818.1 hypothetical protein [Paenibacillus qinlingensis]